LTRDRKGLWVAVAANRRPQRRYGVSVTMLSDALIWSGVALIVAVHVR